MTDFSFEWVGSFAYCPKVIDWEIGENTTHYELVEELESRHSEVKLDARDFACGWLYQDDNEMLVQWSSVEYFAGEDNQQKEAEDFISQVYHKPVREVHGLSQWNDGQTFAKVGIRAPNRAQGIWPTSWEWLTSWLYLPETNEVLMSPNRRENHQQLIENYEDNGGEVSNQFEVGVLLENSYDGKVVIYPEYSDWASNRTELRTVPYSNNDVMRLVRDKATELGYPTPIGVLRDDDYSYSGDRGNGQIYKITKFKTKKKKRRHLHKHEQHGFFGYEGYMLYIPQWQPPIQTPEGGQIDTTGKVAAGNLIKFVSMPSKFLVGEDTHHIYLLEAEFGIGEFPANTGAIGRAWVENDVITGIGFDFGTQSGQQLAIKQLREWAHKEGYETSDELQEDILGLAKVADQEQLFKADQYLTTIPIKLIHITQKDWHGSGWPWFWSRELNTIYLGDSQVYHFTFFEEVEDEEHIRIDELTDMLSQNYLAVPSALADFIIGRYENDIYGPDLGMYSYHGSPEEEAMILKSLNGWYAQNSGLLKRTESDDSENSPEVAYSN